MQPESLPATVDELCDWIEARAASIYVREEFRGKWGPYRLTELPPMRAIHHTLKFIRERRVPVYVANETDGEVEAE